MISRGIFIFKSHIGVSYMAKMKNVSFVKMGWVGNGFIKETFAKLRGKKISCLIRIIC